MIRIVTAWVLTLCVASAAFAQGTATGSIAGTVVDESGAAIPGATVVLAGPVSRSTTTGASGAPYASARRNLDELIAAHLVRVRFFPGTRRRKRVELTPRGVTTVQRALRDIGRQIVTRAPRGNRT